MTDIQQVESVCATQEQPTPDAELIPYNDAVREGKELVRGLDSEDAQFRLGELAHRHKPVYGEGTLRRYAEAIGIVLCTLERYRTVYRAWADILAPGRKLSYAVARALANHPDRAEIIRENPKITKRKAEELMRQYRAQNGGQEPDDDDDDEDEEEQAEEEQAANDEHDQDDDEPDDDEEEEPEPVSEPTWIGRRLIVANKAAGDARIEDWTQYRVEAGLMQAVEDTADAWRRLVEHLRAA